MTENILGVEETEAEHGRLRYVLGQAGFWGALAVLWLAPAFLNPRSGSSAITIPLLFLSLTALASHGLGALYRRRARHWSLGRVALHALWLLPLSAFAVQATIFLLLNGLLRLAPALLLGMIPYTLLNFLFYVMTTTLLLSFWTLTYLLATQFQRRRQSELAYWRSEARLREAEMQFLHKQISSHFLFNAMNNLRALILENPQLARERLTQLANLLRATLQARHESTVPLADELALVRAYLDLEGLQYEQRLQVRIEVDEALLQTRLPPMLLQTLVENAVRHGIAQCPAGGTIAITAHREGDCLRIRISNPQGARSAEGGHGIGLSNARQRLHRVFGEAASLQLSSAAGQVCATLELPA